jgi:hypothetical protein
MTAPAKIEIPVDDQYGPFRRGTVGACAAMTPEQRAADTRVWIARSEQLYRFGLERDFTEYADEQGITMRRLEHENL